MLIKDNDAADVFLPEFLGIYENNSTEQLKEGRKSYSGLKDLYEHYKSDQLKKELELKFTYREFREYSLIFNALISKYITETGEYFKMPFGLGDIGISKFMPRYYKPLYNPKTKTVEINNNPHTNGYVCKFTWIKENARLENKTLFRHTATTNLKRDLFNNIIHNNTAILYQEVSREAEGLTSRRKQINKVKKDEVNEKNSTQISSL